MIFFFWLICGLVVGIIASNRGHNGCLWSLAGFLLGPFALLATIGLSDRNIARRQDELLDETRRQNNWMRRKMYEAEEERRYYEERRYRESMRGLPPEEYYEEEEYEEYDDEDGYADEYVDIEAREGDEIDNEKTEDKSGQ